MISKIMVFLLDMPPSRYYDKETNRLISTVGPVLYSACTVNTTNLRMLCWCFGAPVIFQLYVIMLLIRFNSVKDISICLVCGTNVAITKAYNIRKHYETKHQNKFKDLVMIQKLSFISASKIVSSDPPVLYSGTLAQTFCAFYNKFDFYWEFTNFGAIRYF